MTKSGGVAFKGDPMAAAKTAVELKNELRKAVEAVADGDDMDLEAVERAQELLRDLKELRLRKSVNPKLLLSRHSWKREAATGAVPEEFKCPLSKELMRDPVIVATGQTYDRPFIQKWLSAGNRICPRTKLVFSHTILTPNHLIREMIVQWCRNHGIKLPDSLQCIGDGDGDGEEGLTEADRDHFLNLLGKMASTLSEQRVAAKELRLLTKRMPSFRVLFGESLDAIPQLLAPLSRSKCENEFHSDLQEDLITTLLNISIHDSNKKFVAEMPLVIPVLMNALRLGTIETQSNAAATLFTLSALDSNKALIGNIGALKPLIDLLEEGHPLTMKDVASAIFNLCIIHENKVRAVEDGAVRVILKKIVNRVHVDELLSILAMLSTNQKAIEEMGQLEAVPCLLCIIRETSCARNKENCIAILYTICLSDRSKWKVMRDEESVYCTISQLAQNGTSRAKRKANGIMERLNRTMNRTHSA